MADLLRDRPGVLVRILWALAVGAIVGAAPAAHASSTFVDAVLAEVNGAVVTASDAAIARSLALFDAPPSDAPFRDDDVDRLVDAWLLEREAARLQILPSPEETDAAWRDVAEGLGGTDRLRRWLDRAGLDEAWARRLVEADLRRQRFVDLRFRAFVFVTEDEIATAAGPDASSPEVRERARIALREAAVAQQLAAWLAEARARAAIRRTVIPPAGIPLPFALPDHSRP